MRILLIFIFLTSFIAYQQPALAQTTEPPILKPILLDKTALSGMGLKPIKLKDEPQRAFFQKNIYRGKDLSVYIVSSQSWTTSMDDFSIDEYVYIFNGKSRAKPENGADLFFQTEDHFMIPKGYTGDWEVMAGNHYHYELSVITTKRKPLTQRSQTQKPKLLDKDKLSGADLILNDEGLYEALLFHGDELKAYIRAEKPRTVALIEAAKEQLIRVFSGQVSITDKAGSSHTFYSGDFFILPKGFMGTWESQGHGLFKYMAVEKSE